MVQEFDFLNFIAKLLEFSPRLGINERKTAEFLISTLKSGAVDYEIQEFETAIPVAKKVSLEGDGKKIDCLNASFTGGTINGKHSLISSLIPSRLFLNHENINFNPECKAISLSNFYFAPAVAVSRTDLPKILKARTITAEAKVERYNYNAWNILVGNRESPRAIVFAHYDSLETGACDNASGVSVLMKIALRHPELIKRNLLVFSANEELSYDEPTYWGHGYRAFESENKALMAGTEKLIAVDCVGNGKHLFEQNERMVYLAFPIANAKSWQDKIFILYGDLKKENKVYHSKLDDLSQLSEKHLAAASNILVKELFRLSF
jgi:hypothetical protein